MSTSREVVVYTTPSATLSRHYEFEDVIDSVRASSNECWVLGSEPLKKTRTEVGLAGHMVYVGLTSLRGMV